MCICIILYYMQVYASMMEQKIYYANIYVIFFFNCKLVLLQTCVIDNARFKLNDHNKIPLSLHAGLILTKYVYISHILACTCHDPLGLGCLSDTQTSRDKSQAPPQPGGESAARQAARSQMRTPGWFQDSPYLLFLEKKIDIVYLCCAMKMIFF